MVLTYLLTHPGINPTLPRVFFLRRLPLTQLYMLKKLKSLMRTAFASCRTTDTRISSPPLFPSSRPTALWIILGLELVEGRAIVGLPSLLTTCASSDFHPTLLPSRAPKHLQGKVDCILPKPRRTLLLLLLLLLLIFDAVVATC